MTATTTPGRTIVPGLPPEQYHADPALSASGARLLLPPSCPALYRHDRDNPAPTRKVFEIGHAAHTLVLGTGPELVRIDADEWRSNAVKADVAAARHAGAVPLKPAEHDMVHAMAAALAEHPIAGPLFASGGQTEPSIFWTDQTTGTPLRARPDYLHETRDQLVVADYKTTRSAAPDDLPRTIWDYGYHITAAWYITAAQGGGFVLVFQEKTPPYLVTVAQPDPVAIRIGLVQMRHAIDLFAECTATGRWPGYTDDVELVRLPSWAEAQHAWEIQ